MKIPLPLFAAVIRSPPSQMPYPARARKLETIVHVILGLPAKTGADNEDRALSGKSGYQGIKLQLLHVLKGTDLASVYEQHPFPVMTLEEYLDLLIDCVALLPPELVVIHRRRTKVSADCAALERK